MAEACRLLGLPGRGSSAEERDTLLVDAVAPCFERRFLGEATVAYDEQPVRLAVDLACIYRRPVRHNRFYRKLDDEKARDHRGCAFCRAHMEQKAQTSREKGPLGRLLDATVGRFRPAPVDRARRRFRTPPVKHALRQIEAHQAAAPPGTKRFAYLFEDSPLCGQLPDFFQEVLARGVRPSTFHFMPRADVLLAMRETLGELLPRLRDAGHRLRTLSIGAENFSPDENERFNKGVSADKLWDCFEMMRDLEKRFPGTFGSADPGYFSGILFTPWTRPDDLRANLEAARRIGVDWLHKVVGIRLQMWEGAAVTALARQDGLAAERFAGSLNDLTPVCMSSPNDREVPWRFADPRTARIHQLLVRLEPIPEQALFGDRVV